LLRLSCFAIRTTESGKGKENIKVSLMFGFSISDFRRAESKSEKDTRRNNGGNTPPNDKFPISDFRRAERGIAKGERRNCGGNTPSNKKLSFFDFHREEGKNAKGGSWKSLQMFLRTFYSQFLTSVGRKVEVRKAEGGRAFKCFVALFTLDF